MSRFRRRWLWEIALALLLAAPLALWLLILAPRSNALKLLQRLDQIQVSRTSFNQVQRLASQFGGDAACVGDNCLFEFQNVWLYRLHLAPITEFSVMMQRGGSPADPGGGRVAVIDMAMLVSRDFNGRGTIASALVFDHDRGVGGPFQASITFTADGRPDRTVVQISPAATASQRGQARNFNLQCLTRIGGCRDSHQLLPDVWNGARHLDDVQLPLPSRSWRAAAATSSSTL